ncbi:hypothetical protein ACFL0Y_03310 [Patescibacteria group bacterium]
MTSEKISPEVHNGRPPQGEDALRTAIAIEEGLDPQTSWEGISRHKNQMLRQKPVLDQRKVP